MSPTELLRLTVACEQTAARQVRAGLADHPLTARMEDLATVASELTNNAVLHSGADGRHSIDVRVTRDGDHVTVSVRDPGLAQGSAHVKDPVDTQIGGMGLWLVQQMARRWGAEHRDGYRVWAELALP